MIPRDAVCICSNDDRLLSPCHGAPVYVCFGQFNPGDGVNWSQEIDRYCTVCEGKVDSKQCTEGPGTEFAVKVARREAKLESPCPPTGPTQKD